MFFCPKCLFSAHLIPFLLYPLKILLIKNILESHQNQINHSESNHLKMPRREPSPFGKGYDREGNLVGAAKQAHEAKMAREGKQPGDDEVEPQSGGGGRRSQSPYGRGYDRQGNLVGAAKMAQEMKEQHQGGGQQQSGGRKSRSPSPYGRGYDRQGNLVGAAKMAHEMKEQRGRGQVQ